MWSFRPARAFRRMLLQASSSFRHRVFGLQELAHCFQNVLCGSEAPTNDIDQAPASRILQLRFPLRETGKDAHDRAQAGIETARSPCLFYEAVDCFELLVCERDTMPLYGGEGALELVEQGKCIIVVYLLRDVLESGQQCWLLDEDPDLFELGLVLRMLCDVR